MHPEKLRSCGMRTDKEYYKIFEVKPDWVYLVRGEKPPGKVNFRSVAIKELEGVADGVAIPTDPGEPLTVIEFQEQDNAEIYATTAIKMAALQKMYGMRSVRGVIFFGERRLDPKPSRGTKSSNRLSFGRPWKPSRHDTRNIRWSPCSTRCWHATNKS